MKKQKTHILSWICIIASCVITYASYNYAADLAYSGKSPIVWLSAVGFLVSMGLVLVAIVLRAHSN